MRLGKNPVNITMVAEGYAWVYPFVKIPNNMRLILSSV
ncbi:MAG: hypothetical protein HQ559_15430 [Lentisphaerae bacterium]|nr:hypothetical protein [Lentisphaerota bacterium]